MGYSPYAPPQVPQNNSEMNNPQSFAVPAQPGIFLNLHSNHYLFISEYI